MNDIHENSPIQRVNFPISDERGIKLYMKRDDLIHPEISGNKWRKLKYNILNTKKRGNDTILTFGGAFSNHILAAACAANMYKLNSIGVIRGEEIDNPTLKRAKEYGMQLYFVPRDEYRQRNSLDYIDTLRVLFGNFYLIPEGGANNYGVYGCMEIMKETKQKFDYIASAMGTGTTVAGLILGDEKHKVIGFPALKNASFLLDDVQKILFSSIGSDEMVNEIIQKLIFTNEYHFGGYAKYDENLIDFMREFYKQTNIKLDPIYTAKMAYGLIDMIKNRQIEEGSNICMLHTGGLQGIAGFEKRFGFKIYE